MRALPRLFPFYRTSIVAVNPATAPQWTVPGLDDGHVARDDVSRSVPCCDAAKNAPVTPTRKLPRPAAAGGGRL